MHSLTRHIPIKDVKISRDLLTKKVERLQKYFQSTFGIINPSFALCALNPHAGENGIYHIRSLYFDDYENSCFMDNENGVD